MLTIRELRRVETVAEAYELNQKRMNRVIGGMMWLRLQSGNVGVGIDLSKLGLDTIEETSEYFKIGAMVTLRDLELHEGFNNYTHNAVKEALKHIVGVQFRNLATVGGSVYARCGFSDVLTLLMALDAQVELHNAGIISLREFSKMPYDNDILINIIIQKHALNITYLSHRNSKTDFPVLALALAHINDKWQVSIGATPHRAVVLEDVESRLATGLTADAIEDFAQYVKANLRTSSNSRGSAEYRSHLAYVLTKRALVRMGE